MSAYSNVSAYSYSGVSAYSAISMCCTFSYFCNVALRNLCITTLQNRKMQRKKITAKLDACLRMVFFFPPFSLGVNSGQEKQLVNDLGV